MSVLPLAPGVRADGDFTVESQDGPWVQLIDNVTQSVGWSANYWIYGPNFVRSNFDLVCPNDGTATLTEESDPQVVTANVVKWGRKFWRIPESRSEYQPFAFTYQFLNNIDGKVQVGNLPLVVRSRIDYDYFYVPSGKYRTPDDIPILLVYRLIQYAPSAIYQVSPPAPTGSIIVGENSTLRRWKGNIYERKTRYVPSITAEITS